jgi:chemotaxis protein MotA
MDFGTIIGLVVAFALMVITIAMGGPLVVFVNIPSVMVVILGTIACMFIAYPIPRLKSVAGLIKKVTTSQVRNPEEVMLLMKDMSNRARREGVLALEDVAETLDDPFLKRGIQMVVDGHDPGAIEDVLYNEVDKIAERHADGADIMETGSVLFPAFGMIGTLMGLVQMLQNLEDPTTIGPAMSVALLTTLYGCVIANIMCIPFQKKLNMRSKDELAEKHLIIQGLLSILAGESPRFLVDRLNAQLAPSERLQEAS